MNGSTGIKLILGGNRYRRLKRNERYRRLKRSKDERERGYRGLKRNAGWEGKFPLIIREHWAPFQWSLSFRISSLRNFHSSFSRTSRGGMRVCSQGAGKLGCLEVRGCFLPGSFCPGSLRPGSFRPGSFRSGSFRPGSCCPGTFRPSSFLPNLFRPVLFCPVFFCPVLLCDVSFLPLRPSNALLFSAKRNES